MEPRTQSTLLEDCEGTRGKLRVPSGRAAKIFLSSMTTQVGPGMTEDGP